MLQRFIFLLLSSFYIFSNGIESTFTNFKVQKFEICNDTQDQVKYYGKIITIPFPIEDNVGGTMRIQQKSIIGNNFVELFTIRAKHFCMAMNKYFGELWHDIERQSLIAPGVCPMQQGIYHGQNIKLDFEKISLQTFPFRTLRFTLQGINNTNKEILLCLFMEVDNIPN